MSIRAWIDEARQACLADALEFLRARGFCDTWEEMNALAGEWSAHVASTFDPAEPEPFYHTWNGRAGAANIPTNILDQFTRDYVVAALMLVVAPPYTFAGNLLDFGCGTAALSLAWRADFAPRSRLFLADMDNLPREFVKYRIDKRQDKDVRLVSVDLRDIADNSLDLILCIDVLEHLRTPSDTFRLLDRRLKSGGVLILEAPWSDQGEHLACAPVDWETNGGAELLEARYHRFGRMASGIPLSGLYWKKLSV